MSLDTANCIDRYPTDSSPYSGLTWPPGRTATGRARLAIVPFARQLGIGLGFRDFGGTVHVDRVRVRSTIHLMKAFGLSSPE